jgi:hypothetical protein
MIEDKSILLIGGATRNLGKTALITSILHHFSRQNNISSLKIKSIYKGDDFFHGKDNNPLLENEKYRLSEEFSADNSDAGLMLTAGAKRAFKLKVKAEFLSDGFLEFNDKRDENELLIVESNSLREIVKPGIFIMIKHSQNVDIKPSALRLEHLADLIIYTDGAKHDFSLEQLLIIENKWQLSYK